MTPRIGGLCLVLLLAGTGSGCDDSGGATDITPRRLTRTEYDNAVRDLLGDTSRPAQALPPDERVAGFESNLHTTVDETLVGGYGRIAESLAASVQLEDLLPCRASEGDDCGRKLIASFGRRAFRRPLTDAEVERFFALFSSRAAEGDFDTGARLVIQAILGSPQFLYKVERGTSGRLTQYELASRLSFLLWSSIPDEELLAAAERGELGSAEQIARQTRRMLDDDRARTGLLSFFDQWLELRRMDVTDKAIDVYPGFDAGLRASMKEEVHRFVEDWFWSGDAKLGTLLTSPRTFVNADLASHYGLAVDAGDGWVAADLDPTQRAGILTLSGMLSMLARPGSSSPVARGRFVRSQLLCTTTPQPPPGAEFNLAPAPVMAGVTTRERFAQHVSDPRCAGCHAMMDPIGFGFESYDGIGSFRLEEQGVAIDASGELTGSGDSDGAFDGAVELAHRLGGSSEVRRCVVTQWFRFATGRAETADDQSTLGLLVARFENSGGDFRDLIIAYTTSESFARVR